MMPSQEDPIQNQVHSRILDLVASLDAILKNALSADRKTILDAIVETGKLHLESESCGIFLVCSQTGELVLEADRSDKWGSNFRPVRLKVQSVPRGGLTGHIANKGK